MKKMKPDAIVFDLCGVLISKGFRSAAPQLAKTFGLPIPDIRRAYTQHERPFDLGNIDSKEFWRRVLLDLGRERDPAMLNELVTTAYQWNPGMQSLIDELSKNNLLILLTNFRDEWFNLIDQRLSISRYFSDVVISSRVHKVKPDSSMFLEIPARSGLLLNRLLFIDDVEENVQAASRLGMQTIHFSDSVDLRQTLMHLLT
jgi:putative hydrolase of the HAD superfamily